MPLPVPEFAAPVFSRLPRATVGSIEMKTLQSGANAIGRSGNGPPAGERSRSMRAVIAPVRYVAFALAVFTLVLAAAPSRQAEASAPPWIRASWVSDAAGRNLLRVEGHLFYPGGTVIIEVYQDYASRPLISTATTASVPGVGSVRGGDFVQTLADPTGRGGSFCPEAGLTVIAYDKSTGMGDKVFLPSNCPW
jgi:hypothetical protein